MAAQGRTTNYLFPYPLQTDPVDVAGDIELLAKSIDSQVFEIIGDSIAAMVDNNTESGISVTFNDSTNKLNFDVNDFTITLSGDATGSATVTNLGNTNLEVTVADNSHNHTASNISDFDTAVETLVTGFILSDGIVTPSVTAPTDLLISTDGGDTDWTFKADGTIVFPSSTLNTTATTFDLLNATTTVINFGGAATDIQIGAATGTTNVNNNLDVDGDLNVDGGDFTTTATTFNLLNTTATTINLGGAATSIEIGSTTGTTTINHNTHIEGDLRVDGGDLTTNAATFNLLDTPTTLNIGAAATTLEIGSATGTTNINNNVDIDGDLNIDGNDLTTSSAIFNLLNTTATTVNFAGAATDVQIGSSTGFTTVNNSLTIDGDVAINGGDLTTTATSFTMLASPTTIDIGPAATVLGIGATSGTTTVRNNFNVDLDATIDGDLTVSGGDIISTTATTNLLNTNATAINFGGAATDIQIGSSSGTTNVNNNLDVDGDVNIDGGDLTVSTSVFNLANTTATTLNIGGAATTIELGASTGTTSVNNNLIVDLDGTVSGDLAVNGGDITTTATTFNLLNSTATTVNAFGAATNIEIGAATGTTNINNSLVVEGNLTVNGTTTTINTETLTVEDNIVLLNSNVTGTPTTNAGIEVERGTSANVQLLWNESQDTWVLTKDGTTYYAILSRDDNEYIQDTVAPMLVHNDHIGITATYNDEDNRVVLEAVGGGGGGGTGSASLSDIWWLGV